MLELFNYNDPIDDYRWTNEIAGEMTKNILRLSWHDLLSSDDGVKAEANKFFSSPVDTRNPFFWRKESEGTFKELQKRYFECNGDIEKINEIDKNIDEMLGLDPEE